MIPSSFLEIRAYAERAFVLGSFSWYYLVPKAAMYYKMGYGPVTTWYDI